MTTRADRLRHRERGASGADCPGEVDRAVARGTGRTVSGIGSLSRSRPMPRLKDENSRRKVQNVREDSSVVGQAQRREPFTARRTRFSSSR